MSNENNVLLVQQDDELFGIPINSFVKYLTEEEYAALSTAEKENGNTYLVDGDPLLVVQETGTSMRDVMSQDAVTRELRKLQEQIDAIKSCSCTPSTSNPNPDPPVNPPPTDPPTDNSSTVPPPTGLKAIIVGSVFVNMTWVPPPSMPAGMVVARYTVRISLDNTTWSDISRVPGSIPQVDFAGTEASVRGLQPDTIYYFSVVLNTETDQSRPSNTLIVKTAPIGEHYFPKQD